MHGEQILLKVVSEMCVERGRPQAGVPTSIVTVMILFCVVAPLAISERRSSKLHTLGMYESYPFVYFVPQNA